MYNLENICFKLMCIWDNCLVCFFNEMLRRVWWGFFVEGCEL